MLETTFQNKLIEAGCDEAGRGCLAGSVFAAAVILPPDFHHPLLNDSKQMTERRRNELRQIIEREALAWSVQEVTAERIDQINILNASIEGMNLALKALSIKPEFIVIDGNRFKTDLDIPYQTIVKGDGKYMSIAAASILAKTYRDDCMIRLHKEYPVYHWDKNKGYPAPVHRQAIREHGTSPYHRLSFNLLGSPQMEFDFG